MPKNGSESAAIFDAELCDPRAPASELEDTEDVGPEASLPPYIDWSSPLSEWESGEGAEVGGVEAGG